MVKILREADCAPVMDVAKKHGISDQTILPLAQEVRTAAVTGAGEREAEEARGRAGPGDRVDEGGCCKTMVEAPCVADRWLLLVERSVGSKSVRADVGGQIRVAA